MKEPASERRPPGGSGGAFLTLRKLLARAALVDQERQRRAEQTRKDAAQHDQIRQELHRLSDAVHRIQRENAGLLRLLTGPKLEPEAAAGAGMPQLAVSRQALFSEVERGSRAQIIGQLGPYVAHFGDLGPVVDLGCGRGEFLELAKARGLEAYGVDSDEESVAACTALGLDARREDLFEHLKGLGDECLGGVFCSQVVEHLPPELIPTLMARVYRVLRREGVAVFETPNPATFATHVQSFWRDPTHIRPVPEPALSFAARTAGLAVEDVVFTSRVPDEERLQPLSINVSDPEMRTMAVQLNEIVERLNDLLYGYQDYALVVRKPS